MISDELKKKLSSGGPLHWGIVACGQISNDFVRALTYANNQHKVVATATSNSAKRAQDFIDKVAVDLIKGAKAHGSYDELLKDPNVDCIYVGALNDAHHGIVMKALDCGKHVLCEKPMGANTRQVKEMTAKAKEKQLFLMEAFWSRFFPVYQHIKKLIESKEFGEVLHAHANFSILLPENRHDPKSAESPSNDIGCYVTMFGLFAFSGQSIKQVKVLGGALDQNGCDTWAQTIIEFGSGRHASTYYNSLTTTPCWAYISFEKGQIRIPEWFWCPTELIEVDLRDGEFNDKTPKKTIHFPLNDEKDAENFNFHHSSGLRYEADCVFECLKNGNLECRNMPHEETVRIAEVVDEMRRQLGVIYPQDSQ